MLRQEQGISQKYMLEEIIIWERLLVWNQTNLAEKLKN